MEHTTIKEDDYEIVTKDRTNLWDQLREMMRMQKWTTQDEATTSLLQEMDNVVSLFIVRKSDGFLLGATVLIETADIVYGNVYVMREGYRAAGLGMKLVAVFVDLLGESFKVKPFLARGVTEMLKKYAGAPFYCDFQYELYSFELPDRKSLLELIPPPANHNYTLQSIKDMNHRQFQEFIDYDKYITGVDRTKFLQDFYSIAFVEGVVLRDKAGNIKGMAGIVPKIGDNLYKLAPVYAETEEDAGLLVNAVSLRINNPKAKFVLHIRTQSAGDWILKKCTDMKIPLYLYGVLCNATNMGVLYTDPSKPQLMHIPTNSPAHFDG